MDINAAIAFNRFGLGRRRNEPVPADPRAWLRAQIDSPDPTPTAGGMPSAQALGLVWAATEAGKAAAMVDGQKMKTPEQMALNEFQKAEIAALLANAIETPAGFRERLVWFWTNHFTIAAKGRPAAACAGAYVREAIRPNVTGRFRDMLQAVMRHPAMLSYLDNAGSVGPDSVVGERRHAGLNENLARECLELHTVTPAAGYTQEDVTSFARILTGYSIEMREEPRGFRWRPLSHDK